MQIEKTNSIKEISTYKNFQNMHREVTELNKISHNYCFIRSLEYCFQNDII